MKTADALRLKNAIDLARSQVQDLADNGFEPSRLPSCLQRLDSAVLTATELKAPPALAAALDECVKSCAALSKRPPASAHAPALPMIRILLSAPDYVDFLAAGNVDCPAAWSDLINDSRRQRGESPLFSAAAEPVNPYAAIPSLPPVKKMSGDAEVMSVYRNIRPLLRQCVKLEFTAPTKESAQGVHLLLSKVAEITAQGPVRTLFWVVSLLHASVASGTVPRTPDVLRAGVRASAALSRLARSGLKSKSDASAAAAVRRVMDVPFFTRDADLFDATFCLRAGTVEDAEEVRHVRDVLRGVSGKTIGDFRAALIDAMAAPLAAAPGADSSEAAVGLKRAAAALHVIGLRREAATLETISMDSPGADPSAWRGRARDACQGVLDELDDRRRRFASVRSWLPGQTPSSAKKTPSLSAADRLIKERSEPTTHSIPPESLSISVAEPASSPAPSVAVSLFVVDSLTGASLDPLSLSAEEDTPPSAPESLSLLDVESLSSASPDPFSISAEEFATATPESLSVAASLPPASPSWDFELIDVVPDEPAAPPTEDSPPAARTHQEEETPTVFSSALDDELSWTPPATDPVLFDSPETDTATIQPAIPDDADPEPIRLGPDIPSDLRLLSDDLLTALTLWAREPDPARLDAFRLSARTFLDGSRKHVHHHAAQSATPSAPSDSWTPPKAPPKPEPPVGWLGKIKAMMPPARKN